MVGKGGERGGGGERERERGEGRGGGQKGRKEWELGGNEKLRRGMIHQKIVLVYASVLHLSTAL